MSKELYKELKGWKIPVTKLSPVNTERQYRKGIDSLIQEYRSKPHTPELIDSVWQGFWKQSVNISENQVPRCNLTKEVITLLEKNDKILLLLPDVIFKPKGLLKLASAFPWTRDSWIANINEVQKIKHNSTHGGCVDVEASISTPVDYTLLNESGLRKKIEGQGRCPQRIPTYVTASIFRLLFLGNPLDQIGTSSRLLGSSYKNVVEGVVEHDVLTATFDVSKKRIDVFHEENDGCYPNLGGRSEMVYQEKRNFWQNHHRPGRKVA